MERIRPFSPDDANDLALALNNPKIHQNLRDGLPLPYTPSDAAAFIRTCQTAPPNRQYVWAIQEAGRAIGSIGLYRLDNIHIRSAELGYYLAEAFWGRGFTTQAVEELMHFAFSETDLIRVFAEPFSSNSASCRVLEKAGFQKEGILRSHAIKEGRVLDMALYAYLRADYKRI